MGAYVHLQDVDDFGSTLEPKPDIEDHNPLKGSNCPQCKAEFGSSSLPSSSSSGERTATCATCERRRNSNDCTNFWAGRLDDVFEELQFGTKQVALPKGVESKASLGTENLLNGASTSRECDSANNPCDHLISGMSTNWSTECEEVANTVDEGGCLGGRRSSVAVEVVSSSRNGDFGAECLPGAVAARAADELEPVHHARNFSCKTLVDESEKLPDHLLIELLVRVPTRDWPAAASVKKRWAQLFRGDGLWQSALVRKWPNATAVKRWPGPIARGSSKRRYAALHISDSLFAQDRVHGVSEVAGHVYLFLKEQLESPCPPVSYGLLHGTVIDQFLACQKTGDEAHELATQVWVAVLDNLDESENTFHILMRIAEEWEIFLPYPYSKSRAVQWRLFERLFTDFRDCLSRYNYFDVLTRARSKFELIPQTWLGY